MKKKPAKPDNAWDDDAPVAHTKVKLEKPAERQARHEETHKVIARQAKIAGSRGLPAPDLADIIGKPKKVEPVMVDKGCYMTKQRNTCIVVGVTAFQVQAIFMEDKHGVVYGELGVESFARKYVIAMPQYPVRRAARKYLESKQPKTPLAERTLRALLAT